VLLQLPEVRVGEGARQRKVYNKKPLAEEGCIAVLPADLGPDRPRLRAGVGTLVASTRLPGASSGQCPRRRS
jgi:hypothetical protein